MSQVVDTSQLAQAGQTAIAFVQALLANEQARDFRIEEFQESPDGKSWLITVGFYRPYNLQPLKYLAAVEMQYQDAKIVTIDKERGIPLAMRNGDGG